MLLGLLVEGNLDFAAIASLGGYQSQVDWLLVFLIDWIFTRLQRGAPVADYNFGLWRQSLFLKFFELLEHVLATMEFQVEFMCPQRLLFP